MPYIPYNYIQYVKKQLYLVSLQNMRFPYFVSGTLQLAHIKIYLRGLTLFCYFFPCTTFQYKILINLLFGCKKIIFKFQLNDLSKDSSLDILFHNAYRLVISKLSPNRLALAGLRLALFFNPLPTHPQPTHSNRKIIESSV
jgi:hypothetical protein